MWGIWTEREVLLARDHSPIPQPPVSHSPPHLLLPTDMAHGGGRSWAGGGSQDRHDPLGQYLTHCEGKRPESGTFCFCSRPTHKRTTPPGSGEDPRGSELWDPPPPVWIPGDQSLACSDRGRQRETDQAKSNTGKHVDTMGHVHVCTCVCVCVLRQGLTLQPRPS